MTIMRRPPTPPLSKQARHNEWNKFIASFGFAFRGLLHTLRTQRNMRVHLKVACCALLAGVLLHISAGEFALIFVAIGIVFVTEMFNTAIELTVDIATQEYHELARIAKDVAAGAVLVSAMLAVVIGLFVFVPHLLHFL